jgi:hypothetical protein
MHVLLLPNVESDGSHDAVYGSCLSQHLCATGAEDADELALKHGYVKHYGNAASWSRPSSADDCQLADEC